MGTKLECGSSPSLDRVTRGAAAPASVDTSHPAATTRPTPGIAIRPSPGASPLRPRRRRHLPLCLKPPARAYIKTGPAFRTGPDCSAIYFHLNAGATFSPNFHIRFTHTPTLLDCHIRLAHTLPDCDVGGTGAVFTA